MKPYKAALGVIVFLLLLGASATGVLAESKTGPQKSKVTPGVEVFLQEHLDWVEGKRVGLITNPTGVDRNLVSTSDLLNEHPDVELTALFGPEHGIRGDQEAGEYVESYIDDKTGLPVYSLYGPTWKPTEEMLEDIDVLLFDIQDIGSNVYTYIYTLGFAMEAAAENEKEVIVLDRPNPIGGIRVEGPLRSEETVSFMGRFLLPVRHGMTVGELATMWNHEYSMGIDLKVAKMKGWKRTMHYEDTGLPWVMTSPNIPTKESAYLYAGTELVEDTNLSTGLGTTKPFELVGGPGIDGEALSAEMNQRGLAGVSFRPAYYTPMFGTQEGQWIGGVQVHIDDPSKINLVALGLHLVDAMRDQKPERFEMTSSYANLIGDPDVPRMILDDQPVEQIIDSWQNELETWEEEVRNKYLLYNPYPKGSKPYKNEGALGISPLDVSASVNQSIDLTVSGYDEHGEKLDIDPEEVDWTVNGDIGKVLNGVFHASRKGKGELRAEYGDYTAKRQVDVSTTWLENIRHGIQEDYTRVVFDLNKTISNYRLEEETGQLRLEIPHGKIGGELEETGGRIQINNSPVIKNIHYERNDDRFVAVFDLKTEEISYKTPSYSSRIVVDLMH
ncbi:exo-beta-N-acetylmuramidase NamZ family protein [Salibacterium aidingense]|uniref:exo-beta-N-acetylmuramidase NamZ family protein n=1 Tax=Salibacterium aidingense TaxID=384933 RepID=UPI003BCCE629